MKIKKTLAFIMAAALTVGTMAGCSQTTLNYSKELSNTAKWEASTSSFDGAVNIDVQGIKEEIKFTATGYKAKDKSYVDMKFNDPSGKFNLPELKAYSDGNVAYINKSFFQGLSTMSGQATPAGLANITQEYIGIDTSSSGIDATKINTLISKPDGMAEYAKLLFGENTDLDIPFVQNGREYTLNLDADKTVDLAAKAIKALGNNFDNLNTTFKMGLPAEGITQIKTAVNSADFDKALPQIKEVLAGSTITSKDVFTDNGYNSEFNMNLKIKDAGTISITMKATAAKSEVKEITLPTSVQKITLDEYQKMLLPANTAAATK